jgi:molecular chaperone GrpE
MVKKRDEDNQLEQELAELTADLKRVQADFVNYRMRMDDERQRIIDNTKSATIIKLLPIIDNIERAISHVPPELADNQWVKGIIGLGKSLEKSLSDIGLTRIAAVGQPFDPNMHEAISADGEGEHEVVSDELRAGYKLGDQVMRHSLVKVTRQQEMEPESPEKVQEVIEDTKSVEAKDEVKGED